MHEQNASYLVKHSDLGAKNFNKISLKIVQKILKWPLQFVNFQKISGRACPRTPRSYFNLKMLQNDSAEKKKLPWKNMSKFGATTLKIFLNTPQT